MRVLVWQWGRFGAGPRFAAALAEALGRLDGVTALLSLAARAELLGGPAPPECDLPVRTYAGPGGFLRRAAGAPFQVGELADRLRDLRPALAICAMPGPLDLLMAAALRRIGVPFRVVVHDADAHPGDGSAVQMWLQRRLLRRADRLIALSRHVADRLAAMGAAEVILATHPPFAFGPPPPPPGRHGGRLRLLSFGRLLPYKGLDLLAEALAALGPGAWEARVVGQGPEGPALDRLRALAGVRVENRWVPEAEVPALLAWSDALVLSHREASQSGVAAAALAAGRWIVATRVGGLVEQLAGSAILCPPTASGLADAIRGLLNAPPDPPVPPHPVAAWAALARAVLEQAGLAPDHTRMRTPFSR